MLFAVVAVHVAALGLMLLVHVTALFGMLFVERLAALFGGGLFVFPALVGLGCRFLLLGRLGALDALFRLGFAALLFIVERRGFPLRLFVFFVGHGGAPILRTAAISSACASCSSASLRGGHARCV